MHNISMFLGIAEIVQVTNWPQLKND